MSRRQALRLLGSVAAAAPFPKRDRRPGDKPNLLFLWTDEQRADTMAAYGNHRFRVPALNRLAASSLVFDRCYATRPSARPIGPRC